VWSPAIPWLFWIFPSLLNNLPMPTTPHQSQHTSFLPVPEEN
jgi:hypothetical protein